MKCSSVKVVVVKILYLAYPGIVMENFEVLTQMLNALCCPIGTSTLVCTLYPALLFFFLSSKGSYTVTGEYFIDMPVSTSWNDRSQHRTCPAFDVSCWKTCLFVRRKPGF